jgi:hypothetical protein
MPIHIVWISMVNRLAFNFDQHIDMANGGILWFTDLSAPDPYGILPCISAGINLMNILVRIFNYHTANINYQLEHYNEKNEVLSVPFSINFHSNLDDFSSGKFQKSNDV